MFKIVKVLGCEIIDLCGNLIVEVEVYLEGGFVGFEGYDVVIVEVGGIVGDIELLLFMEVICQLVIEVGCEYVMFMYFILVFYFVVVGEVKIKLI